MKRGVSGSNLDVKLSERTDVLLAVGKKKRDKSMVIPKVLAWIRQSVTGLMDPRTDMGRLE